MAHLQLIFQVVLFIFGHVESLTSSSWKTKIQSKNEDFFLKFRFFYGIIKNGKLLLLFVQSFWRHVFMYPIMIQRHYCQLPKKKNLASWLLIPGRELLYLSLKLSYGLVGWWFHDSIFAYADKKKKLCSDRGQTLNSSSPHLITDYSFTLLISLVICCVVCACACVWWVGRWVVEWTWGLGVGIE